jgi:AbrB family looped-hinge helix DNA binding protein
MSEMVQIDQAGRLVLPKRIRERFALRAGDSLKLELKGDAIELRPARPKVRLTRVNGVLVLSADSQLPEGRDFVTESREDRIRDLAERVKES